MMRFLKHSLAFVLCCVPVLAAAAAPPPAQAARPSSDQVQQLVAPIALYPDPLVAQILAASTYPDEVVEAWRWMQQHSGLTGQQLANAVDPQPWDASVKALTQFPSVVDNMNKNLPWTSALGDAYVNEQQDVLNAVQVLRQRAQTAGKLQSTSMQTVTTQAQTIAIEPAESQIVYVPQYDPWLVYGAPLVPYPDWVAVPGVFYDGPDEYFGMGLGVGLFAGFGWGWRDWGFDWHDRRTIYNHAPYISHGRTFGDHHDFDHGGAHFDHGGDHIDQAGGHFDHGSAHFDHGGEHLDQGGVHFDHSAISRGDGPERSPALHVQPAVQGRANIHPSAFGGFDHGGIVRGFSSRGRSSFGGRR
jgi:hypothetical protein